MSKVIWSILCFLIFSSIALAGKPVPNYKSWSSYPDIPRISANLVKQLKQKGEKIIFVYAGYDNVNVVCGSLYLPYTFVPPQADGSKVNIPFRKDTWIMVYCP